MEAGAPQLLHMEPLMALVGKSLLLALCTAHCALCTYRHAQAQKHLADDTANLAETFIKTKICTLISPDIHSIISSLHK